MRMRTLIAAVLMIGVAGLTVAQDKKNDPTGLWKLTSMFGEKKVESTLKLKLEGDKLTGTISQMFGGKANDTKIEDGKFKDSEVTFSVTREVKDMKFTSKYKGKVDGDSMKGTIEAKFGEKEFKQEFEAKREKEKKDGQ